MRYPMLDRWLLAAMLAWQPARTAQEVERYRGIAEDIAKVAQELPPLITDDASHAKTALLLLSTAYFESGFRQDIDEGRVRGDHGRSWCLMQVKVYGQTPDGWTGIELIAERDKCIRAGYTALKESMRMCRSHDPIDRLAGYIRGYCRKDDKLSQRRIAWAKRWYEKHAHELESTREVAQGG